MFDCMLEFHGLSASAYTLEEKKIDHHRNSMVMNTKNLHNPITKAGKESEEHDSAVEDDGDAKSSRSSIVDIESETESHASERSVLSYRSDQFTRDLGFKKSLMDHIKTRNDNSLQDSMRNPYLYQLHPVIKQTSFTQTDPKTSVSKRTVSTQMAGKTSSASQTVDLKSSGTSQTKFNYSCFGDSGSDLMCFQSSNQKKPCRLHKSSRDVPGVMRLKTNEKRRFNDRHQETRHGPFYREKEQKSYMQANEDPSKNTFFGVSLKHVRTP
ncbi:hypothetical protein CEXT_344751 [Caerostris extrusa]|uniref:Uncharacterized protein n=1 Tax=Caerostris extrusa TaxID=172846 RepID=A0AAV4P1P7_CAEEX|nr:hypothetical protein CEXT_344751 [Caerostris extrusa]